MNPGLWSIFTDGVECGVDQEVHATAGREAGATGMPALRECRRYRNAGATGMPALRECRRYGNAGATGMRALQVRDPSALYKQSEIDSTSTGKML